MSVATPAPSRLKSWHRFSLRPSRIYFWGVSLVWLAILGWNLATEGIPTSSNALALLPWITALAVVNMVPVKTWPHADFTPDVPIFIAGVLVLSPIEIGLANFIGCFDRKEFIGQTTVSKATFNRSQAGLAAFISSTVVHGLVQFPGPSSFVLPLAFLVLACTLIVNYVLVGVGICLEYECEPRTALQRMSVGTPSDFVLALVSWAVVGAMLAVLNEQVGPVALIAFLAPTILGRQALARSQMFIDTTRDYRTSQAALGQITHQIYEERVDERRLIAADLHDEVLQPLFKVSLMAHVLKADLASGRLLEVDQDLPELLTAAELASAGLRELIGDLRRSRVGPAGLASAIRTLARMIGTHSTAKIEVATEPVSTGDSGELVIYHLVKEALTNAVMHSGASHIWVELRQEESGTHVSVTDDGAGFDPLSEYEGHYGIQIMRERTRSVGGEMYLDSEPGAGTRITAMFPSRGRPSTN